MPVSLATYGVANLSHRVSTWVKQACTMRTARGAPQGWLLASSAVGGRNDWQGSITKAPTDRVGRS